MTTTVAQKPKTQKRGRPQSPQVHQLHLLGTESTEPVSADIPQHPLIAKVDNTAYLYWGCDRYRVNCAYTGRKMGYPFYEREVKFILSRFEGRRSPVSDAEFWSAVQTASKLPIQRKGAAA